MAFDQTPYRVQAFTAASLPGVPASANSLENLRGDIAYLLSYSSVRAAKPGGLADAAKMTIWFTAIANYFNVIAAGTGGIGVVP